MVLICALSGEVTSNAVVTPSGRICDEKLLLSKLADNGGTDPFTKQPLDSDTLIHLQSSKQNGSDDIIPPRPSVTSMPSLLQLLNSEYFNLVLELFDTRQLLEETRKELSQALYQNDAAVRVIARMTMERDAARQELSQWKASGGGSNTTTTTTTTVQDANDGPSKKKRARVTEDDDDDDAAMTDATATTNKKHGKIPPSDIQVMTETWQKLSQERKANKKQIAAAAPASVQELQDSTTELHVKRYHKSSGKQGIVDMSVVVGGVVVTAGKDKQVCVYQNDQVVQTYSVLAKKVAAAVVEDDKVIVAVATGTAKKNQVILYSGEDTIATIDMEEEVVVGLDMHPSGQYVIATSTNRISIYSVSGGALVTSFENSVSSPIVCGALHPDGFIHAVGLENGQWSLWDFKSQTLAATLGQEGSLAINSIVFSNNGYHVATIASNHQVTVWDLKKQASLAVLEDISNVTAVAFDGSGKYLACGTSATKGGAIEVVQVKDWKNHATLSKVTAVSQLAWTSTELITTKDTTRAVKFYGKQAE